LGAASLAVIVLALAFGWRRSLSGVILWSLAGIFALFTGLIAAMVLVDDTSGPPTLWLGLPAATALLVYGVWPLGVLPSLLYACRFRDAVLPEDRLERFLAAHSRHNKR
jgi:hydrogenase/urease accessory protein HupE